MLIPAKRDLRGLGQYLLHIQMSCDEGTEGKKFLYSKIKVESTKI